MNLRIALTAFLLFVGRLPGADTSVPLDLAARDDARKIAIKFRDRGYVVRPVADGVQRGAASVYQITLERGTDCVIMAGIDGGMAVDLYVKDEVGNVIVRDTRPISRACVSFTTSYNGVYDVIVVPHPKANLAGNFALIVGIKPPGQPDN